MVCQIYVDGSFSNGSTGYGIVILKDGEVIEELFGLVPAEFVSGTHQIAGELYAVTKAIQWCQRNSVREMDVFYDYDGIEKWASGEWKTKKHLTRSYAELIRNSGININWHKVDSHTGDRWNERADGLASKAVRSASPGADMEDLASELGNEAEEFVAFLRDRGYKAKLKGIYGNSDCAKIEVTDGDKSIGYINIYRTKRVPFLPRYHELKDQSYSEKLDLLWQEYCYGERQLPLDLP